jgi:TRAP-type C4-dicarboxylate transport system permease small subunit
VRIFKWLDEYFEEYVLLALLAVISCVMLLQVCMRFIFNNSLPWPEELTRYCFIWSTFISISYCVKKRTMLRIDLLAQALPRILRHSLEIVTELIVFVFFGYLFFNSIDVVKAIYASGQISPANGIPMYLIYIATTVGFALTLVRCIQSIIYLIAKLGQEKSGNMALKGR